MEADPNILASRGLEKDQNRAIAPAVQADPNILVNRGLAARVNNVSAEQHRAGLHVRHTRASRVATGRPVLRVSTDHHRERILRLVVTQSAAMERAVIQNRVEARIEVIVPSARAEPSIPNDPALGRRESDVRVRKVAAQVTMHRDPTDSAQRNVKSRVSRSSRVLLVSSVLAPLMSIPICFACMAANRFSKCCALN